jgi:hypothetical protein
VARPESVRRSNARQPRATHMNLDHTPKQSDDYLDQLRTFRDAAEKLGIPYFKIQRAAKRGLIPPTQS